MIYSVYSIALKNGWFDIYINASVWLCDVWLPRAAFKLDETENMKSDAGYFFKDCFKIPFFSAFFGPRQLVLGLTSI